MKGLLLKDIYMACKYCRAYLLITIVFIAVSMFSDGNLFFVFYPCMLAGIIPVNLLSYDESSKWHIYSGALPYTRGQLVSVKYLMGLMAQVLVMVLCGGAQFVRMYRSGMYQNGGFDPKEWLVMMGMLLILSCLPTAICLPLMFKLGVEKGRMAYYVMIGVVCAGSVVASAAVDVLPGGFLLSLPAEWAAWIGCIVAVAVYALSWILSIRFYEKRELI